MFHMEGDHYMDNRNRKHFWRRRFGTKKRLSGVLGVLIAVCMAVTGTASAVFAESPAAIADTYSVNGVTYYNIASSSFSSSEINFFSDLLKTNSSVIGNQSAAYHWNRIGSHVWNCGINRYSVELGIDGYILDALLNEWSVDKSGELKMMGELMSASNMKQAEANILRAVSTDGSFNLNNKPRLADMLEKMGKFQEDTDNGPVFYQACYGGKALSTAGVRVSGVGAYALVFSDFKVNPLLPKDEGSNYIYKTVKDLTSEKGTESNDAINNTPLEAEFTQELTTSTAASVSSEVNGSRSYSLGNTVKIGLEHDFVLVQAAFETEFSSSTEISNGWSESKEHSEENSVTRGVNVTLPAYTGVLLKQTTKTQEVRTEYNCPVSISYRVRVLDYACMGNSSAVSDGKATVVADFMNNAQANLKERAFTNYGHTDPDDINWTYVLDGSRESAQYMSQSVPMASTPAAFTEKLSTVQTVVDCYKPLLPLKIIQMVSQDEEVEMKPGDSMRIDNIALEGLNANKCAYSDFDSENGQWKLLNSDGDEMTDGSVARLTKSSSGRETLTAVAPGKVKLKYFIDEDKYGTLNNPTGYATNANLTKTAVIEITIKPIPVESITLNESNIELAVGDNANLSAAVYPENATDSRIAWSSGDEGIASVDDNGTVTAVSPGTVTITASSRDGSNKKASCSVKVKGQMHTVIFEDGQGKTIDTQTVEDGKAAVEPAAPVREGYDFKGWDKDFNNIKADLVVKALWEKKADNPTNPDNPSNPTNPTNPDNPAEPAARPKSEVSPENPASATAKEKEILNAKTDKDANGSSFSLLQAKATPKSKTSIKLTWTKVEGANKYIVYGSPCGKGIKKIKTVTGTSFTQKKLKKGKYYKYVIVAANGGNALAVSKTVHVTTKGGKRGNNTGVTAMFKKKAVKKVSLKAGQSKKLTAKLKAGKLKVNLHRKIAWESDNISVATVSGGKIKAVKAGTCTIYAYAQNGICAKVKVIVK